MVSFETDINSGTVTTKLAAQTLRLLLDLVYHEQVSAPIETVFDVLLAADRYKVQCTVIFMNIQSLEISFLFN